MCAKSVTKTVHSSLPNLKLAIKNINNVPQGAVNEAEVYKIEMYDFLFGILLNPLLARHLC